MPACPSKARTCSKSCCCSSTSIATPWRRSWGFSIGYTNVCCCALSCAFHRAHVIRSAPARRDCEHRADAERRELGSLGPLRTVAEKPSVIERRPGHSLKRRWDMFALTRGVPVVYITRGGTSHATRRRDTRASTLCLPWISEDIDSIRMTPQSLAVREDVSRVHQL